MRVESTGYETKGLDNAFLEDGRSKDVYRQVW